MAKPQRELSARQLIEAKLKEMPDDGAEFVYLCKDTGSSFTTSGAPAEYSPFTGSQNVEPVESSTEDSQMTDTPIPSNQNDPFSQTPLEMNPTGELSFPWLTTQASDNSAPDLQSLIGGVQADGQGYLGYPELQVPPFVKKKPGEKE